MMIKSYISTALRNLWKNQFFTSVNIIGLSVALFIAFNVLVFVLYQFSFDKQHIKRDRIFLAQSYLTEFQKTRFRTAYLVAQALKDDYPEIEEAMRYAQLRSIKIEYKDEYVRASNFYAADDNIFKVFSIPLIDDVDAANLLTDINSLLISERIAKNLFGEKNPIGKTVKVRIKGKERVLTVRAVFKNVPENSTFKPNYLCHIDLSLDGLGKYSSEKTAADIKNNWGRRDWYTFVLLADKGSEQVLSEKLSGFISSYAGVNIKTELQLHPFSSFYSDYYISYDILYMLIVLGLLVVFVAAANYIILSSALSIGRSKEIGLRKVMGAMPADIRKQFLGESVLLSLLALPFSILLFKLLLPTIMPILEVPITYVDGHFYYYIPYFVFLSLIIGLLSGFYVSYHLANIQVVKVLKTRFIKLSSKSLFRKILIIFQLLIVIILLVSILTIKLQYHYGQTKDLGFNKDNIVLVDFNYGFDKSDVYLQKIKQNPNILMAASAMEGPPTNSSMSYMISTFDGSNEKVRLEGMDVGFGFLEVFDFEMIEGRFFSKDFPSDSGATIINETAVRQLKIENPIGKFIEDSKIIGVVKDFNFHSLHYPIPPLNIEISEAKYISQIAVKVQEGKLPETIGFLKKEWDNLGTDLPFRCRSFDETLSDLYYYESLYSNIIAAITLIIALIALSGLFGLTLFMTKRKQKELGIRKVFGAPIHSIRKSLIKEFVIQVFVAYIIAIPISWFLMNEYLQQYAYQTALKWWLFVVPGVITLIVVLFTVLYFINKAARTNVVEVLKEE